MVKSLRSLVPTALLAVVLVSLTGCAVRRHYSLTQAGTIDALLAGAYDGQFFCDELLQKGDLGLGTFDRLDGELVVLDGRLYQVRADGRVYDPPARLTTPFAAVVPFHPQQSFPLGDTTFRQFQEQFDGKLPSTNLVCAFRVTGSFREMKTRSVPAQTKPYRPLVEVTGNQPVFDLGRCQGTLVGFRLPGFVKGINVPGFHVHFLTADRLAGGHVLDFVLERGTLEVATYSRMEMLLPRDAAALQGIDFSRDRSQDLEKVEK